jgi:8-oxo-dGTP pyrophosphatase MutT (NUDIX family)
VLDLDPSRQGPPPRDSSTLLVVREGRDAAPEVFCVERHNKIGFLGGAVVFPGGKLEPADLDPAWASVVVEPAPTRTPIADDAATLRGLAIAACREALEEAAILPVVGPARPHDELLAWRAEVARVDVAAGSTRLRAILEGCGAKLDLAALRPLSRWVTPVAESRRFDTRFFVFAASGVVTGAHDDHETTASFWASPAAVLGRFDRREIVLAPPTHRTLEVLAPARNVAELLAIADAACLDPICPRAVPVREPAGDTMAIVLPGDPEHDIGTRRIAGTTRYVLRDGRFLPEDAP